MRRRSERSKTRIVESEAIRVEASRDNPERLMLMLPGAPELVAPTHWSFGQLASLVGAPATYLRQLPAPLAGINLQYGLSTHRAEQVKTLEIENGRLELRAVTAPTTEGFATMSSSTRCRRSPATERVTHAGRFPACKRAAFKRKQRLEREALPLFADTIAEGQHSVDEEMARRHVWWDEREHAQRALRAARSPPTSFRAARSERPGRAYR